MDTQILEANGVRRKDIVDNCHLLQFPYNGLEVTVIDHDIRLVGDMHRKPVGVAERKQYKEGKKKDSWGLDLEEATRFIRQFNYRRFIFDGNSSDAIRKVLELARKPIEEVIKAYREEYHDVHGIQRTWTSSEDALR